MKKTVMIFAALFALAPLAASAKTVIVCTVPATPVPKYGFSPKLEREWIMENVSSAKVWTCSNGQTGNFATIAKGKRILQFGGNSYVKPKTKNSMSELIYPMAIFTNK